MLGISDVSASAAEWVVHAFPWSYQGQTTVAHLRGLTTPPTRPDNGRVPPTELATFRIHGVLIGWKLETSDRDMHLVIADPAHPTRTMIAEVPSTACDHVCSSGHVTQFRAARAALIAKFGTPSSSYHKFATPQPITVTGVGFFDFPHSQTGAAPNQIELHPVLLIQIWISNWPASFVTTNLTHYPLWRH